MRESRDKQETERGKQWSMGNVLAAERESRTEREHEACKCWMREVYMAL